MENQTTEHFVFGPELPSVLRRGSVMFGIPLVALALVPILAVAAGDLVAIDLRITPGEVALMFIAAIVVTVSVGMTWRAIRAAGRRRTTLIIRSGESV